jgi:hypothetical protein
MANLTGYAQLATNFMNLSHTHMLCVVFAHAVDGTTAVETAGFRRPFETATI